MRGLFLVFTNPASADNEDAFHEWLDHEHIPAVLEKAGAGVVRATRYAVSGAQAPSEQLTGHRFLVIYEIEADDLTAAMATLMQAQRDGKLGSSAGMTSKDPPSMTVVFEEIREPQVASSEPAASATG